MKKIIQILFIFTFCIVYGQKNDLSNKINLSIVLPEEDEIVIFPLLRTLKSRVFI